MACGRPAVVTGVSPATDFCDDATACLVPAARKAFPADRVGDLETVGRPWLSEPDVAALAEALRQAAAAPALVREKGRHGAEQMGKNWTWEATARTVISRITRLAEM